MQKFILTIGREFGSRGGEIGKIVADYYQIPFYDKNTLDQFAMNMKYIKPGDLEHLEDLAKSGLPIKLWSATDRTILKSIYECETEYIQVFAKEKGGVFIGRCADYILEGQPNLLCCFIYSPIGVRLNYLVNKYGLTPDATETLIQRMDHSRHDYYKYFTKQNRGERHNRQLFLDSSLLGVEGSAELLKFIIDHKFS